MIEEEGTVIELRQDSALIKAERTTACDSCSSKSRCQTLSDTDAVVEALNTVGARSGDHVVFTVGAGTILKAGVLLYLFPLIGFIAGVVAGQAASGFFPASWNKDLVSAVFGFALLSVVYLALSFYSRAAQTKSAYMPTIVRVIT